MAPILFFQEDLSPECHKGRPCPAVIENHFHHISSSNEYRKASLNCLSAGSALWRQHLFCPGALKQGICVSGPEKLSFLYAPKEKKMWLLLPNPCHPPDQALLTVWLTQISNTELLTRSMLRQHEATSTGKRPAALRLEQPIGHPARTSLPRENSFQLPTQDPAAGCNCILTRDRLTQTSDLMPF